MRKILFSFVLMLWGVGAIGATSHTLGNYKLSRSMRERLGNKVYKMQVRPQWNGAVFWYKNSLADGKFEYIWVDAETGERRAAFDTSRLVDGLKAAGAGTFDPERLVLDKWKFNDDSSELTFRIKGKRWSCRLSDYSVTAMERPAVDNMKPFATQMRTSDIAFYGRCNVSND